MVCSVNGGQHHKNSHNCNFLRGSLSNVCSSSDTPCCYETKKEKWVTKKGGGGAASILPQYSHVRKVSRRQFSLIQIGTKRAYCHLWDYEFWFRNFRRGLVSVTLNRHELWRVWQNACPCCSRWSTFLHLFFGRPVFPLPVGLYLSACLYIVPFFTTFTVRKINRNLKIKDVKK